MPKTPTSFTVPSVDDFSEDLRALKARHAELGVQRAAAAKELRETRSKLDADRSPHVPAGVAELLGDGPDTRAGYRERIAELTRQITTLDRALPILATRITEAASAASVAACAAVKPEFQRRVAAVCDALAAVQTARNDYVDLVDGLNTEGIQWTRLGPLSLHFLGDQRDGHIDRVLREARAEGNYV